MHAYSDGLIVTKAAGLLTSLLLSNHPNKLQHKIKSAENVPIYHVYKFAAGELPSVEWDRASLAMSPSDGSSPCIGAEKKSSLYSNTRVGTNVT